ncbi:MAG: DUF72 domain-containing protein [Candidatus Micrarchaeia archaeon]
MLNVGCCGWNFFSPNQIIGRDWRKTYSSRLQAYASIFDVIEVDSTFYKLPMISTAKRWRAEVDKVNANFEFIVKAPKAITHTSSFGPGATAALKGFIAVARALRASKLLFQTPPSFGFTKENYNAVKTFMARVPGSYVKIWEPRGSWLQHLDEARIGDVTLAVDPLRSTIIAEQGIYYYRLHGFGKGMMYSYKFSEGELRRIAKIAKEHAAYNTYIMFNNTYMYEDAIKLKSILHIAPAQVF